MYEADIVCDECDSEYTIVVHNSEEAPKFCPFCGSEQNDEEED